MHCSSPPLQGAPGAIGSTRFFPPRRGVWEEWAEKPLEVPGSYFSFPDKSETSLGLSHPSPFSPQGGSENVQCSDSLRRKRGEEGDSGLSRWFAARGLLPAPFGEVGRQDAGAARPLRGRKAGGQAEGGVASGSISLGVRNDSWFTKGHCLLR